MERTNNYCFTTDSFDSSRIEDLRKEVKFFNARRKAEEMLQPNMPKRRYRVKIRARLGKDNPNAYLYRFGGIHHRRSSQDIRPEHGTRFDVYIHQA